MCVVGRPPTSSSPRPLSTPCAEVSTASSTSQLHNTEDERDTRSPRHPRRRRSHRHDTSVRLDPALALHRWAPRSVGGVAVRLGLVRPAPPSSRAEPSPHRDRCPRCRALAWDVGTIADPVGNRRCTVLTSAAPMGDDVVHTCRHQRMLRSTDYVDEWLEAQRQRSRLRHGTGDSVELRSRLVLRTPPLQLPASRTERSHQLHASCWPPGRCLGSVAQP